MFVNNSNYIDFNTQKHINEENRDTEGVSIRTIIRMKDIFEVVSSL